LSSHMKCLLSASNLNASERTNQCKYLLFILLS
jgi:hypothetical protein